MSNLERFLEAQEQSYSQALAEIKKGSKQSHWMWYIFPQLKGLGRSETAKYYGIANIEEAGDYLRHPVLGKRLIEISGELMKVNNKEATVIFGTPDDLKLRSCMTLFADVENTHPVFREVLVKYFYGLPDIVTLQLLQK
jgi:uncharacterized protein (DUF1810 family)